MMMSAGSNSTRIALFAVLFFFLGMILYSNFSSEPRGEVSKNKQKKKPQRQLIFLSSIKEV